MTGIKSASQIEANFLDSTRLEAYQVPSLLIFQLNCCFDLEDLAHCTLTSQLFSATASHEVILIKSSTGA